MPKIALRLVTLPVSDAHPIGGPYQSAHKIVRCRGDVECPSLFPVMLCYDVEETIPYAYPLIIGMHHQSMHFLNPVIDGMHESYNGYECDYAFPVVCAIAFAPIVNVCVQIVITPKTSPF